MASVDENVEALSRAILSEAHDETQKVKSDAEAKADEIRRQAQEQADEERKKILQQASQEAERLRSQAVATAQLRARSSELSHREKLLDRVFKAVKQQLPEISKRPDYDQIVAGLIRESLEQLGAEKAEVRVDKATQRLLTPAKLEEIAKDAHVRLSTGKPLEQGMGVMVDASDGHLHFDNTLETRLNRLQSRLRPVVYQILMGETQ